MIEVYKIESEPAEILVMPIALDAEWVVRDWLVSAAGGIYLRTAREDALVFSKCIIQAVAWMHSKGVMHLDIKLRNLLLTERGAMVLSDFGCARRLSREADLVWGTEEFRCPEYVASTGADVWSVGKVLDMVWRFAPVDEGLTWTIPVCVSSAISLCLERDPSKRPSMGSILEEPAWQAVPDVRAQYLCWEAERRLRTGAWYSYLTTCRTEEEPTMQVLMQAIRQQISVRGYGDGHVEDNEWCWC